MNDHEETNAADMELLWRRIGMQAITNASVLSLPKLERLRQEFDRADAIGPFIDPTAYQRMDRAGVMENRELLQATIDYVRTIHRIDTARRARQGKPPLKPEAASA